jgi:HAE1 family hydrophobic/amphiphilic exporter-1
MSIAELSIRRPVTTIMFFVSLFVIGLIAAVRLPLEAFPSVTPPLIFVHLPYTGSTPEEVERTVLRPVEEALSTMSGIKRTEGTARADGADFLVFFTDWSRNIAIAASDARQRIDAIRDQLPEGLQRYTIQKFDAGDQPVLKVRLASSTQNLTGAYDLIDRQFKRPLERIPGVAKVDVSGASPNEVEIAISPDRLTAHNISLNDLTNTLKAANFSLSAGLVDDGGQRLRVEPVGELTDLSQLTNMVIGSTGVRLGDIADVRLKPARMDYGRRLDGQPAVGLDIYKEREANLVDVSTNALKEVEAIRKDPALSGIQVKIIDNQGDNVTSSLTSLAEAGGIGLVLSIAVLFFFLRHWPSTLMVTLAIPICFVMTLGFMYFAGVTLNILSMMGLLLAVGMLVDNAVVVVESIYQERERNPGQPRLASILGTRHVAIALSAGTLCHCIVFVPNLFGERNFLAIYLSQIAITISVSLLASWLVAVSLIPMISARLKTPPTLGAGAASKGLIPRLQRRYAELLRWTLEHRGKSVLGIVLIIAISIVPVMLTKKNMFGGDGGEQVGIDYQWNGSYTKEQMSDEVLRIEHFLDVNRAKYHIKQIYSYYSEQQGANTVVTFDSKDAKITKPLSDRISKELPKSARARITLGDQGDNGGAPGQNVEVQLVGDSTQTLTDLANDIIPSLARHKELRDVRMDAGDRNSELTVHVDRERAAAFGFSTEDVSRFVGLALRGAPLREFRRGETEVPVWVRFAGAEHFGMQEIDSFTVRTADGRTVPLSSMVDVRVIPGANEIKRMNRQTALKITAKLPDKVTMPEARKVMEDALKATSFPAGYSYTFEGSAFGDDADASKQMMFNLLIALVMIYIVMSAVFESLLFPAAIMSGVLFSVFGVFWLFWLTGTEFNIMAFIGILVLMGVVVNNGIVMIEHINNLRRRGMSRTDALVEGSRERLRPIMMTMGTAILAMVPIALSTSNTTQNMPAYYPMARAIAGGLAFSTIVSLLFLPTIYAILDDLRHGTSRVIARARKRRGEGGIPAAAVAAITAE